MIVHCQVRDNRICVDHLLSSKKQSIESQSNKFFFTVYSERIGNEYHSGGTMSRVRIPTFVSCIVNEVFVSRHSMSCFIDEVYQTLSFKSILCFEPEPILSYIILRKAGRPGYPAERP